jgi:hypothetical protein
MTTLDRNHAGSRTRLRTVTALVGAYLGISALTLLAIILLRNDPRIVTTAVWIRGTLVVGSAILLLVFTRRASTGLARAYLRVRLVSAILLVAIVVIVALPGTFPTWMKPQQAVCGLVLLAVVVLVNGRRLRAFFADR